MSFIWNTLEALCVEAVSLILKHEVPSDRDRGTMCQSRLLCPHRYWTKPSPSEEPPRRVLAWHRDAVGRCRMSPAGLWDVSVWVNVQLHSPAAVCLITSVHTMRLRSSRWNILTLQMIKPLCPTGGVSNVHAHAHVCVCVSATKRLTSFTPCPLISFLYLQASAHRYKILDSRQWKSFSISVCIKHYLFVMAWRKTRWLALLQKENERYERRNLSCQFRERGFS